jgi:hypothetical protein
MEETGLWKLLAESPKMGALLIATISSVLGYSLKTLIEYFLSLRKKKAELRELFWKEKIQSAKKASEFYYEHLSFLNLLSQNIDNEINEKEYSEALAISFQNQISELSKKTTNPSNYEHHHVNIFYDFDETELNQLNKESFEIIQDLETTKILETDSSEQIGKKWNDSKEYRKKLKSNHEKAMKIYRRYLKHIREDIRKFVE